MNEDSLLENIFKVMICDFNLMNIECTYIFKYYDKENLLSFCELVMQQQKKILTKLYLN
jgi:hypothetical protein